MRKKWILVVDDDDRILRMVTMLLTGAGYEVDQATHGEEALAKYTQASVSRCHALVITDVQMPGMSGIQLAKSIRAINPDQPIIVCSARSAEELAEQGTPVPPGMTLVHKPFSPGELIRLISTKLA